MMTPKEFIMDVIDALQKCKLDPTTKLLPKYTNKSVVIRYIYSEFELQTSSDAKTTHKFDIWVFEDDVIDLIDKMNNILSELMRKFEARGFKFRIGSPRNNSDGNQYYLSIPIEYSTFLHIQK